MEGWNDPMDLSKFEPTGKLKINLNKRVAFPLNKSSDSSSQEPLRELPTVPLLPMPPSNSSNKEEDNNETKFDPQEAKANVVKILEESIKDITDSNVRSSVTVKLKALENEFDNCDKDLQKLLLQLAEFIEQKDAKSAGGVQRKIIMKGYNKSWMQGIRQIVFNLESKNESIAE